MCKIKLKLVGVGIVKLVLACLCLPLPNAAEPNYPLLQPAPASTALPSHQMPVHQIHTCKYAFAFAKVERQSF